eukprot:scaffold212634_cov43-Attheya_sp.AAC.1
MSSHRLQHYDDVIRSIAEEPLKAALLKIGDGSGLVFSSHEQVMMNDGYQDIASLDTDRFGNTRDYFTSFFRSGYHEFVSNEKIKTKISWVQSSCICLDIMCNKTAAIDIEGIDEADNGEYRGRSPVVLLDEDGQELPCLGHSKIPPIVDLDVRGCRWAHRTPRRRVYDCGPEGVEELRFIDKESGNTVGRSLNKTEILPKLSNADPNWKLVEAVNNPLLTLPEAIVQFEATILGFEVPISFDIAPFINTAMTQLVLTPFDIIFQALRPGDFTTDSPASEARLSEIVRVTDAFSNARLMSSVVGTGTFVDATIRASPLYMTLAGSRPETSAPQEIISGIALLGLASCGFGAFLGSFCQPKNAFRRTITSLFSLVVSAMVLILEGIAYYIRWEAEADQNDFNEAMVLVDVAGADRFDGIIPLSAGKDGDTFVATTYVVELSDASYNFSWMFLLGSIVSAVGFCISFSLGWALGADDF